jgi:hypothetical protein
LGKIAIRLLENRKIHFEEKIEESGLEEFDLTALKEALKPPVQIGNRITDESETFLTFFKTHFTDQALIKKVDHLQSSIAPGKDNEIDGITKAYIDLLNKKRLSLKRKDGFLNPDPPVQTVPLPRKASQLPGEKTEKYIVEKTYIENAGMVLSGPYLPMLFKRLGLLEASVFKDWRVMEKAVHVLEFMVNKSMEAPEYRLVLNKILCGIEPGIPIKRKVPILQKEIEIIEGLISSMIQHWKILGTTSIDGFRESFLIREGKLTRKDNAWELLVEPKPFDMLLDRIPWSYSIIKHPWMNRVIHVKWR